MRSTSGFKNIYYDKLLKAWVYHIRRNRQKHRCRFFGDYNDKSVLNRAVEYKKYYETKQKEYKKHYQTKQKEYKKYYKTKQKEYKKHYETKQKDITNTIEHKNIKADLTNNKLKINYLIN